MAKERKIGTSDPFTLIPFAPSPEKREKGKSYI
jgi:hypothetical protein